MLEAFLLSSESREMTKQENESTKSFILRLGRTFDSWVKYSNITVTSEDARNLSQLMIRDQILLKVPEDTKKHSMQTKVLDTIELAKRAEYYSRLSPIDVVKRMQNSHKIGMV